MGRLSRTRMPRHLCPPSLLSFSPPLCRKGRIGAEAGVQTLLPLPTQLEAPRLPRLLAVQAVDAAGGPAIAGRVGLCGRGRRRVRGGRTISQSVPDEWHPTLQAARHRRGAATRGCAAVWPTGHRSHSYHTGDSRLNSDAQRQSSCLDELDGPPRAFYSILFSSASTSLFDCLRDDGPEGPRFLIFEIRVGHRPERSEI